MGYTWPIKAILLKITKNLYKLFEINPVDISLVLVNEKQFNVMRGKEIKSNRCTLIAH